MDDRYLHGFWGGMLIGLAAVFLYWCNGRIMGVSGILSRLLQSFSQDSLWRMSFISGLFMGRIFYPFPVEIKIEASYPVIIVAGLLVGFGTVLGNGCTSGHGICGIARLSKRSVAATGVFMLVGMITVFLRKMWGG